MKQELGFDALPYVNRLISRSTLHWSIRCELLAARCNGAGTVFDGLVGLQLQSIQDIHSALVASFSTYVMRLTGIISIHSPGW